MTPTGQRIGIIVIAIVMIIGTFVSFAVLIIGNENAISQQEREALDQQELMLQQQAEQQELSDEYYPLFEEYEDRPAAFEADDVGDDVVYTDLKAGDGEVISDDSVYRAYYIGWNPRGVVFDSSFAGDSLKPPLNVGPGSLVAGWYEGVEGMKIGGVREITMPSDFAYGESGQGDDIPPNTPIKFIVMAIPAGE